jgi:hypothetical protein
MKSESLARGGVMTMTSVDNLDGCSCFGGVCAACVVSQVGWVCFGGLVWPWGSLVLFVSVFPWFSPKKLDTFFLINRLGQCLLPLFKKNTQANTTFDADHKTSLRM